MSEPPQNVEKPKAEDPKTPLDNLKTILSQVESPGNPAAKAKVSELISLLKSHPAASISSDELKKLIQATLGDLEGLF